MKIVAISVKGQEYLYNYNTAHAVSNRSADEICRILNSVKYKLREGLTWFVHEIDHYDNAYIYAQEQKFRIRRGIVTDVTSGY